MSSLPPLTPCPRCGQPHRQYPGRGTDQVCRACYRREVQAHVPPERTSAMPLPVEPCPYAPGTPEQMAVLAGRVARGEQLYHPDDRTDCEGMIGHPSRGIDPPAPQPEPWRPQYHPCRDCGSRVVDAPGERCGRCCRPRRRRPAPVPPPVSDPTPSPAEEICPVPDHTTNGAVSAPAPPPAPAVRRAPGQAARVEALCRELGPGVTIAQVHERLLVDGYPPCSTSTFSISRRAVHGPQRPGPKPGSGHGGSRPRVQTPAPAIGEPRRVPVAETAAPPVPAAPSTPAAADDALALVDDLLRLGERWGWDALAHLVGRLARRGGAG